jgi:hypothetical protein
MVERKTGLLPVEILRIHGQRACPDGRPPEVLHMFTVYETLTGRIIATDVTLTQAYGIRDAQRAYHFSRPQHAVRIAPARPSDREGGTR